MPKYNSGGSTISGWTADSGIASGGSTIDWEGYGGGGGPAGSGTNTSLLTTVEVPPTHVLNTIRYGDFTLTITGLAVSIAHTVVLYFCEGYPDAGDGSRSGTYKINGTTVLTAFDVVHEAGAVRKAIARSFTATSNSSGEILIEAITVSGIAQLSAINIIAPDTTAPDDVTLGTTTALSATSARFAFTPPADNSGGSGIAGLNWEFDTVNTFDSGNLIQEFVSGNTSPHDKTGLLAGRRWYGRAKTKDAAATPNFSVNWSNTVYVDLQPTIDTTSLNNAVLGESFSQTLSKTGGDGTWSIQSGAPSGAGINGSSGEITWGTPTPIGTISGIVVRFTVTTSGLYAERTFSITVIEMLPLNYGFSPKEVELFCEAQNLSLSDGNNVTSFTDQSIHARHLTAASAYPTFQTNEINSLPVVRFSSSNPLKNTAAFTFQCGWILAKYDGATFPDTSDGYRGLLSDLVDNAILSGKRNSNEFKDFGFDLYEFRSNDRIYSVDDEGELHAPAPMSGFKLIFFRFWNPIEVDGIQLGQELSNTNRKWSGDVALLILTSRDYVEEEIRSRSEAMAEAYNLTLADVFPFQPDYDGTEEGCVQSINQYDAPEGERFAEAIDESRRLLNLKFSGADKDEIKEMKKFHKEHFASATLCLFRDYRFTPPQDIEGYINSAYKIDGKPNDWNYSFDFQEK